MTHSDIGEKYIGPVGISSMHWESALAAKSMDIYGDGTSVVGGPASTLVCIAETSGPSKGANEACFSDFSRAFIVDWGEKKMDSVSDPRYFPRLAFVL